MDFQLDDTWTAGALQWHIIPGCVFTMSTSLIQLNIGWISPENRRRENSTTTQKWRKNFAEVINVNKTKQKTSEESRERKKTESRWKSGKTAWKSPERLELVRVLGEGIPNNQFKLINLLFQSKIFNSFYRNSSSSQNVPVRPPIYPSADVAFKVLLSARICASIWSNISDCDETFNYWEPLHYLLYKKGLQTWEYDPVYALRSYTYLYLHGVPAYIYNQIFEPNPMLIFYFIRLLLGLTCACAEVYFYK